MENSSEIYSVVDCFYYQARPGLVDKKYPLMVGNQNRWGGEISKQHQENTSHEDGGGIYSKSGKLVVTGSTFSRNSTIDGLDVPITGINNLIQTEGSSPCGTTDPINKVDPKLGALTGSPAYLPLLDGSPAIDAGDDATCAVPHVNNISQNFIARPHGLHCDIGSVEYSENLYVIYLSIVMKN